MASRTEGQIDIQDVVKIVGLLFSGVALFFVTRTAVRAVQRTTETSEG